MDESKLREQHELLSELLAGANLQCYLDVLIHNLKVHSTAQLKYVRDDDLLEVGMTKPEVQRLMKLYRKQATQPGKLTKLKKVCIIRLAFCSMLTTFCDNRKMLMLVLSIYMHPVTNELHCLRVPEQITYRLCVLALSSWNSADVPCWWGPSPDTSRRHSTPSAL